MKRPWTSFLLVAGMVPAAALAGPQYTAEEIIEHFSATPPAGAAAAQPATRGVFIGAAGFGSEAGATAAASQGASGAAAASPDTGGAAAAAAPQAGSAEPLAIPMTGAKAGLAAPAAGAEPGEVGAVAAATGQAAAAAPGPGSYDLLITFDLDSATLTPQARENLGAFVAALQSRALQPYRFAVDGHTDATGSEDYNQALSERRAASVVDYLVAHGVESSRLVARGYGETRPRDTGDPEDAENRRVETRRIE